MERAYIGFLLVHTFYFPRSHNIKFLRSLAEDVDQRLTAAWPREGRPERRRFEMLKRAYVEARYSDQYDISHEYLTALTGSAEGLAELVRSISEERLATLGGNLLWPLKWTGFLIHLSGFVSVSWSGFDRSAGLSDRGLGRELAILDFLDKVHQGRTGDSVRLGLSIDVGGIPLERVGGSRHGGSPARRRRSAKRACTTPGEFPRG